MAEHCRRRLWNLGSKSGNCTFRGGHRGEDAGCTKGLVRGFPRPASYLPCVPALATSWQTEGFCRANAKDADAKDGRSDPVQMQDPLSPVGSCACRLSVRHPQNIGYRSATHGLYPARSAMRRQHVGSVSKAFLPRVGRVQARRLFWI